jgi:hypothetical protein
MHFSMANAWNAASQVRWNSGSRQTTFISGTQLTAAISAFDLATSGLMRSGDNMRVDWRTQFCAWGGLEKDQNGIWNRVFDVYSMSRYALTVYFVGPKGVKPWADGKQ